MKWLDITKLCEDILPSIRERTGRKIEIAGIYYYSAYATHRSVDTVQRHKLFVAALESRGVIAEIASFKQKDVVCKRCQATYAHHSEKETDVAVGCRIIELAASRAVDGVILMTGDTDLKPALRTARRINPTFTIVCAFPFNRKSAPLAALAHHAIEIDSKRYRRCQFPEEIVLGDGTKLVKPADW